MQTTDLCPILHGQHPPRSQKGGVKIQKPTGGQSSGSGDNYRNGEPIEALIEERGLLYRAIAERVWAPKALGLLIPAAEPASGTPEQVRRSRRRSDVSLSDLVRAGLLLPDSALIGRRRGKQHRATLLANGKIRIATGDQYTAPSPAAMEAAESNSENGWAFWRVEDTGETLGSVRDRFRPLE